MERHEDRNIDGSRSQSSSPVQRQAVEGGAGKRSLVETVQGQGAPVQRSAVGAAAVGAGDPSAIASQATQGAGGELPYKDQIQASFGRHDVSGIRSFQGGETAPAMQALGARAFAHGDAVAFNGAPDLHTAAHEAAHVVQQRGGVQRKASPEGAAGNPDGGTGGPGGGLDEPGDAYEQHADAVADRVVAGQSAEALLDGMAGGGAAAVQRKPEDKPNDKPRDTTPELPDGVNVQILSNGSVVVRASWIESAPDKEVTAEGTKSPTRIGEILRALKSAGFLYWVADTKIAEHADSLVLAGTFDSKTRPFNKLNIAFSVYVQVGPPPGVTVMFSRQGRGLTGIIRQSALIPGPIIVATKVELSEQVRRELWTALENYTGIPLPAATKEGLIKNPDPWRPEVLPGQEGLGFDLPQATLERLYGKKPWNEYVEKPVSDEQGSGAIGTTGGVKFTADVPEEDRQYFLEWMKQIASGGGGGGGADVSIVTPQLIAKLREIDADPELKKKVLAKLAGAGTGPGKPFDSQLLESVLNAIRADDARAKLGMDPPSGSPYKPIFDQPVRGTIVNRGGLNYVGQETEFYFETQNRMDAFAVPYVDVRWVMTRKDKPTEHLAEDTTGHVEFRTPDTFSYEWKQIGIYTVHAFVTHNFYQPAHFEIDVEVKTEQQRTQEINDPAFKGLAGKTTYETGPNDWPFDVSWFNTLFGGKNQEYGKKVWGTTPDDFVRMSYEDRVKFLATDKQRLKDMIAAHTNAKGEPTDARWADMVAYAKERLKSLEETEQVLGKENAAGNTFFEARGTFLSRKNGIPDKPLRLVASAAKDKDNIKTIVHDFTQLHEPMDYTFTASGTTFEKSIEATFVDLAKTYPPGRISCLFEALDDNLAPNKKTVDFELDTGTAWKDVKSVVYNPGVMIAVNIVGAATMVFLPVTAPVLFPMLAVYNSVETIDNMAQLQAKGNLTWGSVAKGVAQIGLNFLPYVGELKVVANMGKTAMYTLEGVTIAGMAVLMTLDGMEQIRRLRDRDISEIGQLDEQIRELERTNKSDPQLPALRARLEQMIKQAQGRSTEVIQDMAKTGAVMLVQMAALKGLQTQMKNSSVKTLKSQGLYEHAPGVEPHYDAKTGRIIGDETKFDTGKIAKLKEQYAADQAAKQTELANVLGTDKVEITRGGDKVTVTKNKDGEGYKVQIPKDKPFSQALDEAWAARKAADPNAPAERPPPVIAEITPIVDPRALVTSRNVAVGSSLRTETEAHAVLRKLASGDRTAFTALGIEAPPPEFDLRSVEWGIGQKPDGSFLIIRGEPGAVNWSGFGGIRPVAHSHPLNPQKLLTGGSVTFSELVSGAAGEVNKVNVFPSAADVQFCVVNGVNEHVVQTPYASKGGGKVGNPTPGAGEPLVQIKIVQPERVGSWGGNDALGVYKSRMVATDAKGNQLWTGEVWTTDHPGLGSVVMFEEPPSGLLTKKVAGQTPGTTTTKTTDPTHTRWVTDLPGQLTADEQARLALMTRGKSPSEVYDMFGGDLAVAKAKIAGSNLTPELFQLRATLSGDALRAFDNKWNAMIGNDRAPSADKITAFQGYLDAMAKRAGGDLVKGLEAEAAKIPPGKVVAAPRAADYPPSWDKFDATHNAEFKTELEKFRGSDLLEPHYGGGEGNVFLGDSPDTALKRWYKNRLKDFATSIAKLRDARAAVLGDPVLSKQLDVVEIQRTGSDWIQREFVTGTSELSGLTTGPAETARLEAVKALKAKPALSETERQILKKLEDRSDNLHWSPTSKKIVIIDMQ